MKDLYYVAQEISKQKNLKGNLLKYATGMASMYTGLAYMKLSMNYYTVYDMRQENATVNPVFEELLATTNGVIDKLLSGQAEDVTEVETVRNRLIETMEVVTQYVDCLRIYEYVLNRVEHRFSGQVADEEYYGMYLTNDLMHYILADKDNVVINSKISEVVGQLPMRLSRNKFFECLRRSIYVIPRLHRKARSMILPMHCAQRRCYRKSRALKHFFLKCMTVTERLPMQIMQN